MLARVVGCRITVPCWGVPGGLLPPLCLPSCRIGLEVVNHGSGQIPVGGDVVALRDLSGLGVLVVARSHQSIVSQVATDVGRDDLPVDTVARNEVLVGATGSATRA